MSLFRSSVSWLACSNIYFVPGARSALARKLKRNYSGYLVEVGSNVRFAYFAAFNNATVASFITYTNHLHNMRQSIIAIITLTFFGVACSTVPLTGRKQLSLIPDAQINALSFQNYQQVLQENNVVTNTEQAKLVKKVGKKISYAVEKYMKAEGLQDQIDDFKWEFNLIEDETVNAWCMPGGKVAFYTGIMPICQDEAGVAVVMSHEIAHAIAEHGNERMSQQLTAQMGGMALSWP